MLNQVYLKGKWDEIVMLKKFVIIDVMEQQYYYYNDSITQGFSLDKLLEERNRYGIPYKIEYYNNGKVIIIKSR